MTCLHKAKRFAGAARPRPVGVRQACSGVICRRVRMRRVQDAGCAAGLGPDMACAARSGRIGAGTDSHGAGGGTRQCPRRKPYAAARCICANRGLPACSSVKIMSRYGIRGAEIRRPGIASRPAHACAAAYLHRAGLFAPGPTIFTICPCDGCAGRLTVRAPAGEIVRQSAICAAARPAGAKQNCITELRLAETRSGLSGALSGLLPTKVDDSFLYDFPMFGGVVSKKRLRLLQSVRLRVF